VALPLLRSVVREHGPVALVHFDAHLDTWDTYFNAPVTHGTIFRRAFEESLLIEEHSIHVGIRGPIYGAADLGDDRRFGFHNRDLRPDHPARPAGEGRVTSAADAAMRARR